MNPSEVLLLAFLIGVIAGLRTLTAPAVVAWAANRHWLFDVAAQRFLTHSLHYEDQSEAANAYAARRARQMAVLLHLSDAVRNTRFAT